MIRVERPRLEAPLSPRARLMKFLEGVSPDSPRGKAVSLAVAEARIDVVFGGIERRDARDKAKARAANALTGDLVGEALIQHLLARGAFARDIVDAYRVEASKRSADADVAAEEVASSLEADLQGLRWEYRKLE